jgi:hypothetical protein
LDEKWLRPENYLAPELMRPKDRINEAQWSDIERRSGGIYSIEIKTGWSGRAQEITMTINRGWERELTTTLPRDHTALLLPLLIFEARLAIQRHFGGGAVSPHDISNWALRRCPECGLGPFGPNVLAAKVVALMETAPTLDAVYAIYDEHIAPVFDEVQSAPGRPIRRILDTIDKRRSDFGAD